jgi:hypothetical protein
VTNLFPPCTTAIRFRKRNYRDVLLEARDFYNCALQEQTSEDLPIVEFSILGCLNNGCARSNKEYAFCLRVKLVNYLDFVSRQEIFIIKYSRRGISEN